MHGEDRGGEVFKEGEGRGLVGGVRGEGDVGVVGVEEGGVGGEEGGEEGGEGDGGGEGGVREDEEGFWWCVSGVRR